VLEPFWKFQAGLAGIDISGCCYHNPPICPQ
jgi:hypothetical protein